MNRFVGLLVFVLWCATAGSAFAQSIHRPGTVIRDCRDCPAMVVVPAGRFEMGSNADEQARFGVAPQYTVTELPAHTVRIARPFAVERTTVTRDEWARYVAATTDVARGCTVLDRAAGAWGDDAARSWRDPGFAQGGDEPVVCVNLADARGYAAWMSVKTGHAYRLPSEAEWEYAARAGSSGANYWGDTLDDACSHTNAADQARMRATTSKVDAALAFPCDDGYAYTAPVDAFPPNAFGLYGMSGNVNQIVEDCFHPSYDDAPADGAVWPGGDCRYHMDRGASWVNSPRFVRVAMRHRDLVGARLSVVGFRLVRELDP